MKKMFYWITFLVIAVLLVACGDQGQTGTDQASGDTAPKEEKINP